MLILLWGLVLAVGTVKTALRCAHKSLGNKVDISECFGLLAPPLHIEDCDSGTCPRSSKLYSTFVVVL